MRHAHVLWRKGKKERGGERREEGEGGGTGGGGGGEDKVRIVILHNVCIQPIPQGGVRSKITPWGIVCTHCELTNCACLSCQNGDHWSPLPTLRDGSLSTTHTTAGKCLPCYILGHALHSYIHTRGMQAMRTAEDS